jgi:hypothetical protein
MEFFFIYFFENETHFYDDENHNNYIPKEEIILMELHELKTNRKRCTLTSWSCYGSIGP